MPYAYMSRLICIAVIVFSFVVAVPASATDYQTILLPTFKQMVLEDTVERFTVFERIRYAQSSWAIHTQGFMGDVFYNTRTLMNTICSLEGDVIMLHTHTFTSYHQFVADWWYKQQGTSEQAHQTTTDVPFFVPDSWEKQIVAMAFEKLVPVFVPPSLSDTRSFLQLVWLANEDPDCRATPVLSVAGVSGVWEFSASSIASFDEQSKVELFIEKYRSLRFATMALYEDDAFVAYQEGNSKALSAETINRQKARDALIALLADYGITATFISYYM